VAGSSKAIYYFNRSRRNPTRSGPVCAPSSSTSSSATCSSNMEYTVHTATASYRFADSDPSPELNVVYWLDYFVLSTFYELLCYIPSRLLERQFYRPSGALNISKSLLAIFGYGNGQSPGEIILELLGSTFGALREVFYVVLLVSVFCKGTEIIQPTRRILVRFVDNSAHSVTGFRIIASSKTEKTTTEGSSDELSWVINVVTKYIKSHIPPGLGHAVSIAKCLPQAMILFLPSFILVYVGAFVETFLPVAFSLKAVEVKNYESSAYWLAYFSLNRLVRMAWMRLLAAGFLSLVPFKTHAYFLTVLAVQFICIDPYGFLYWILKAFGLSKAHVVSPGAVASATS